MIRVGVVGIGGRMGSLIARGIAMQEDMVLCGASEVEGNALIGRDAGAALGLEETGCTVACGAAAAFEACDVIIDFSQPAATMQHVRFAAQGHKAIVIGTTGLSAEQRAEIDDLAGGIAIVLAPNMSIGVNVMFKVAGILTELLGAAYDVEIVETHHRLKQDAPSGTARGLAEAVAAARQVALDEHARFERHGIIGARKEGEIGIQSLRAGDVVGDHTVMFAGGGERIELTHRAHSRENFARGALRAARWVSGKEPGLYSMLDVLGLEP